jgi:uncharacterized membrane protein YdjX (TVP38/TMEM64 family)
VPDEPFSIRRPTLEDFIFEGEETPLLLQKRVLAAVVLGFVALVAVYFGVSQYFGWSYEIDAEPFRDWVEDRGVWAPIVFMLVMALSVLFAPIPNVPIFIAAGLIWGPVLGTVYSQVGLVAGSVLAFYAARIVGRRHLPRLIGSRATQQVDHLADVMGGRIVFVARLIPIVNFDLISFAAGLTSIRFWPFFVATFFGTLIPTALAVIAGDALQRNVWITIGIGALWVLGLVVSAAWLWRRQRASRRARSRSAAS